MDQDNLYQAQVYLTEALLTAREIDKRASIATRLGKLGLTFYLQGKMEECRQCFRECIPLARGLRRFRKINILILIVNYIDIPNIADSVYILGAIDNSQSKNERPIDPLQKRYYDRIVRRAVDLLGEVGFNSAFAEGQKKSLDEALNLAFKIVEEL